MAIHPFLQIRRTVILLGALLFLTSCRYSSMHIDYSPYVQENISVSQALEIAQRENKYLWMVLGSKENCGHTSDFLKALTVNGFFEKYRDKFIFYSCNVSEPENEPYLYILSPGAMPNSYIFNHNGKIASLFGNQRDLIEFANTQAESVLNGTPYNPPLLEEYSTGGKKLLQYLDTLINTAHMSLSHNRDTLSMAKNRLLRTDSLNRNYYYHYLMTRIADRLNDTALRTQHANLAYDLFSAAKNPALQLTLNDRIKHYSSHYKKEAAHSAELYFDKEVLNYGKIKLGKVYDRTVIVENKGSAPLVILDTYTACDCVQAEYSRAPLLPGKKATVTIHYNANTKGIFLKSIVFRSNASDKLQKIILDGEVI